MNAVFKGTNNEVDEYTTKYFAKAMRKQNINSLIVNLGAEAPTIEIKQRQPPNEVEIKKEEPVAQPEAQPETPEDLNMGGLFGGGDDY